MSFHLLFLLCTYNTNKYYPLLDMIRGQLQSLHFLDFPIFPLHFPPLKKKIVLDILLWEGNKIYDNPTRWTKWPINEFHANNLNWWQFCPYHNIHVYSISIPDNFSPVIISKYILYPLLELTYSYRYIVGWRMKTFHNHWRASHQEQSGQCQRNQFHFYTQGKINIFLFTDKKFN